jgi:peroxiredoxin
MMRIRFGLLIAIFTASASIAIALPPGAPAPDFKGIDSNGVQHSLSEYRGKFVVLEWANRGCPYEKKHYLSGNMESLQKQWTAKGVVWLSILSDGPGE